MKISLNWLLLFFLFFQTAVSHAAENNTLAWTIDAEIQLNSWQADLEEWQTQAPSLSQLEERQNAVFSLKQKADDCVMDIADQLEFLQEKLNALGEETEDEAPELNKRRKALAKKKQALDSDLAVCRLLSIGFNEVSIRVAVRGILNVMRELGMLAKGKSRKQKPSAVLRSSSWVRAPISGILRAQVKLGDMVAKGDVLGMISDPAVDSDEVVTSTSDGIIIGRTNIPLVYEGEALFHIGRTRQTSLLEEHLDTLQDEDALTTPELVEEPVIV